MGSFIDEVETYKKMLLLQKENEGLSAHTHREYKNNLNSFIQYMSEQEKKKPKPLCPDDLDELFLHEYLQWRSKHSRKPNGISQATKREYMVIVKNLLKFITKKSAKKYDFLAILEDWKIKVGHKQRKYLTDEQVLRLLDYIDMMEGVTDPKEIQKLLIVKLLYYTGVRAFELRSLKLSDFQFDGEESYAIKFFGKGNKEAWTYIRKDLVEHELNNLPYKYVCETRFKTPMSHVWLWKLMGKIFEEAGFDATGVHIMRHQFAKTLVDKGTTLTTIMELMRHADVKTTQIYTRSDEKAKKKAVLAAFR